MLRIIDARTGEPADAAPARRGLTRVEAHASGYDASGLRVLLVADLLVRALELGGTPVWSLLTGDREQAELRAGAEALGIRPFEDSRDLGAALGEAQVVQVAAMSGAALRATDGDPGTGGGSGREGDGEGAASDGRRAGGGDGASRGGPGGGVLVAVAPVEATVTFTPTSTDSDTDADQAARADAGGGADVSAGAGDGPGASADAAGAGAGGGSAVSGGLGHGPAADDEARAAAEDPAVWRLVLLGRRHGQPLRIDERALREAGRTLTEWRRAVAGWARRPSRPIPDDVRGRLRGAWEDDLDVPAVLRVLEWVATRPDLADGARFETYAYADRLLGLDLTRDLGHAR
ncbi:hypothetical protein ACFW88_28360 [Streptomyces anandii]|uniref:Cysteinyl-tRNA synthetase n=1 Tax=Streptomyces anandii TaxID=285454 RepID=A0ABW6HCQ2_9ACTN